MPVQALVGEGVGGELVAQEALDDRFGVGDGVQGHGMPGLPSAIASTAQARTSWAMLCPVKTNKVPRANRSETGHFYLVGFGALGGARRFG